MYQPLRGNGGRERGRERERRESEKERDLFICPHLSLGVVSFLITSSVQEALLLLVVVVQSPMSPTQVFV